MDTPATLVDQIQTLAAKLLATSPAGHQLYLIGGFRYRLLNASCRASTDIDYHWDGDLDSKQAEIIDVLRKKLLPEVKRLFAYDGEVRPGTGPDSESPAVRVVEMAFYRLAEPGSRVEIPIEITRIARLDPPVVRTVAGIVFLTVSDEDMIESKIIALIGRHFTRPRDILDVFLFQDSLRSDASRRLSQKLHQGGTSSSDALERLDRLQANRLVHVRAIDRLLDDQVDSAVAASLRAAGGGAMIWDTVLRLLQGIFAVPRNRTHEIHRLARLPGRPTRPPPETAVHRDRTGQRGRHFSGRAERRTVTPAQTRRDRPVRPRAVRAARQGAKGAVPPEILVPAIDSHAYITGHYALLVHGLVTQVPTVITCFTDRRSPRARQRRTPVGRLLFICVRSKVYCPMPHRAIAPAAQALCDYVYLCRRGGVAPEALVTLRNLSRRETPDLADILARYPITVERHVERLLAV